MKIIRSLLYGAAAAISCTLVPSTACGGEEVVVEDAFDTNFSEWKIWSGSPKLREGKLFLEIDQGEQTEGRYRNSGIATLNNEKLNFLRAPVVISFSGISMSGTARDENCLFDLWIGTESAFDMSQKASFHFYIRPGGKACARLFLRSAENGESKPTNALEMIVAPPIKSLVLKLNSEGLEISVEDSTGTQVKEVAWAQPLHAGLLSEWQNAWSEASPVFLIKATEGADAGNFQVAIDDLKITTASP